AGRELQRPLQVRLGLRRWRCRRGPGLCGGAWHPPVRGCFRGRRGCAAGLRRLWFASPHRDRTGRQGFQELRGRPAQGSRVALFYWRGRGETGAKEEPRLGRVQAAGEGRPHPQGEPAAMGDVP
ncbi:TSO2, partial [Symbiodinium sp. CCMP2456]